jgi:hypothetical protein
VTLEMQTFVPRVDDRIIPLWLERLNGLGMHCEIHPDFSFTSHSGFLPFKVCITKSNRSGLAGVEYLTGFEFYLNDFSLEQAILQAMPRLTLLGKLFRKHPTRTEFAPPEIEQILARCTKVLSFSWGTQDALELRMASLSSLILAKLLHGIAYYPADDIWYTDPNAITMSLAEIEGYEASNESANLHLHEFRKWL